MKMIKKNQLTIIVIALMLITAGYLNYSTYNGEVELASSNSIVENGENIAGIGDAKLVYSKDIVLEDSDIVQNETAIDTVSENSINEEENSIKEEKEKSGEKSEDSSNEVIETASKTNVNNLNSEFYVKSRLERETMYSQMIEVYQKLLENTNVSADQKAIAQKEIDNINKTKNAIMISESLIKSKNIGDCIIYVNDKSINVIVQKNDLLPEDIAQIQNIISRELKAEIGDIHISQK